MLQIQMGGSRSLRRRSVLHNVSVTSSRGVTIISSGGPSVRVDTRDAVTESIHEAFDLVTRASATSFESTWTGFRTSSRLKFA